MSEYIEIHSYKKTLDKCERYLELVVAGRGEETPWGGLSARNAELILKYERSCTLLENVRMPTRLKYIDKLVHFAKDFLRLDFESATRDDLKRAVSEVDAATLADGRARYTANSRETIRATIKKFYRWLSYGDSYNSPENRFHPPPEISWMNTQINKAEYKKVRASDLLTEDDILALINHAGNPRDRAYVCMLYELGARVGEHGSLKIKHLTKTDHGYIVDLFGKTLDRTPALILASPYIGEWLNVHPGRTDPESPLWVDTAQRNSKRPIMYQGLSYLIKRVAKRAGITRRIYNHIFRHSRVTHVLVHGLMTESQCKLYFGWTPDSKMLAEYSHLRMIDVNKNYLASFGLCEGQENKNKLMPQICPRCKHINTIEAVICARCNALLSVKAIHEVHDTKNAFDRVMDIVLNYPAVSKVIREHQDELNRVIAQHVATEKSLEHLKAPEESSTNKVSQDQSEAY